VVPFIYLFFILDDMSSVDSDLSSGKWQHFDLHGFLKDWVLKHHITMVALNDLLAGLQNIDPSLPQDGRTLKESPRDLVLAPCDQGIYYHFGIKVGLLFLLKQMQTSSHVDNHLSLQVNFDGVSLFKSSVTTLWPILGHCMGVGNSTFIIGCYYGNKKPSAQSYLSPFVAEAHYIMTNGLQIDGIQYQISMHFGCDAPARCFVKQIRSFTGYNGCDRCTAAGEYEGRIVFTQHTAPERTDDSFRNQVDAVHHHGISPLTQLSIDMVRDFPHDYLHVVCEGVMQKLLLLWISGPLQWRISRNLFSQLEAHLCSLKPRIPSEFARTPRSLRHIGLWKATELRQFAFYTGLVLLSNVLTTEQYDHFVCFSVICRLLSTSEVEKCTESLSYAKQLTIYFLRETERIYGKEFMVYNVHSLVHMCDDVARFGPLHEFSCFKFENFLRFVRRCVHSPFMPLNQIVKRVTESNPCLNQFRPIASGITFFGPHSNVPLTDFSTHSQYMKVDVRGIIFGQKDCDSYFFCSKKNVVKI
jgi:hypothetical protein